MLRFLSACSATCERAADAERVEDRELTVASGQLL